MDRTDPRGGRTDDLSWAIAFRQHHPACWFCRRPGVTGTALLGTNGTKIPCCADGTGCQDGRIHHGPPDFTVHWPDEPCGACARASQFAARRIAGNRPRRPAGGSNSSPHHR